MVPEPAKTVGLKALVGNGEPAGYWAIVGAYDAKPGAGLPVQTQLGGQLPGGPAKSGLTTLPPMSMMLTDAPNAWISEIVAETSIDAKTTTEWILNIL